jgi:hypothetical protein
MRRSKPRQRARASRALTYIGRSCHRCGGRKRYTANAGCYHCINAVAVAYKRLKADHRAILSAVHSCSRADSPHTVAT